MVANNFPKLNINLNNWDKLQVILIHKDGSFSSVNTISCGDSLIFDSAITSELEHHRNL